jgi:asparagine synthase (glutamine-hydrolysing)
MCGIGGWALSGAANAAREDLDRMMNALGHRGPDEAGEVLAETRSGAERIALGHRRLSIIDLSTGQQPMSSSDGSVQLVFNGEIYNFAELRHELAERGRRFRTGSDTEVIIEAYLEYGDACVSMLRGMFAFALWDVRHERLLLARDRFGKKPLFIYEAPGVLIFASEIKALLTHPAAPREVDPAGVWDYLAYKYVPGPRTLFRGIRKIPPATYAVWQSGVLTPTVYFRPPDHAAYEDRVIEADPVGAFLDVLDESVRLRMVSDVPFGAFLSGGIDSSAVVAMMTRHSQLPVKTFSVGFAERRYSELAYAGEVARLFATEHHELEVSERNIIDELPRLVRYRDAPVSEPSDIPIYLLSKEAARSVKMVLTGEGSDEILGGYPKHVVERYAAVYQAVPRFLRSGLVEPLLRLLPYRYYRIKIAAAALGLDRWEERMPRWFGTLSPAERRVLWRGAPPALDGEAILQPDRDASLLRRILFFDQTSWLPDNLLERGDRMTMAASIEARMPFMDHKLGEYVSSLPDRYRIRGTRTKWLLREAMKRVLPRSILERPKVGFRVPVNEWFRGPMRGYMLEHLAGDDSRIRRYLHRQPVQTLLDEHLSGRQNHEKLLWSLLNLEIWHRQYFPA